MRFLSVLAICLAAPLAGQAEGLLDGRVFEGVIGPAENPDLEDRLHFEDGQFWSGICTRCGFVPGPYSAERSDRGIAFTGVLESEDRGLFRYEGVVSADGRVDVDITWERRRWYWTNTREIVFRGEAVPGTGRARLRDVLRDAAAPPVGDDPLCARF